ncbi:MAG: ABC transporter ATP-binding protein [Bacteriovoracaceae bacterium]|jgi:putative ABC transport system ATP-binding protein/lipoprotein-releasing system ATP-binding protein|nr:ABC transporter ATP-binding protein [Bacteriovoracaceae bacterium]
MIQCEYISKEFGEPPQRILHDINLSISDGEFVSISGRSGSGKSTLLYIISSLDDPTYGKVIIDGQITSKMNVKEIHEFRNKHVGFIFQFHYLLSELTALENILLPPRNLGLYEEYHERALELLKKMNISHVVNKLPSQMSGGEQQRVSIARALIMDPKYLFADEPTGNLDSVNGEIVMEILKEINQQRKTTICLVTHDPDYSKMAQREIFLSDGRVVDSL